MTTTTAAPEVPLPAFVRSLRWFPGKHDSVLGVNDGALIAVLLPMALASFGLGFLRR